MLNKLYYVFGVDTSNFYDDNEIITENTLNTFRQLKNYFKENVIKDENRNYEKKIVNQKISEYKTQLKTQIAEKIETPRTLRADRLYDSNNKPVLSKRVAIFDSVLTRVFELKEREFNEEILIIKVYYFDIAHSIVKNGFYFNGEKYVFFSSSAGQIRTKKMVAVKQSLLDKHWNTLTAGLTIEGINKQGGMNLNKYLSYLALCNSATDEWHGFDIDRCIVVDDFENTITGEVDYIDENTFEISRVTKELEFTQTDGCGMMLPSVSRKNFMVRLPWVKGLLASFDFRKFIQANKCSPIIKDIYGVEHDIVKEDIQIILTKSQFKMNKYFSNWSEYKNNFKSYHCQAGICNLEEDVFPDAVINYQMIQTLYDLTDKEIQTLGFKNKQDIDNLATNPKTMLKVFGATPWNKNKTGFQKCLELYPELLSDSYTKQTLKDIKNKLEKDLWSAKFNIGGKYTFVIPDLYAFCENLFLGIKQPKGLLADTEVSCALFENGEELDCLRSPHLYIEHPIRVNNIQSEWFETKAIYISCHDLISRIVQCDFDGDKLLVTNNSVLVNAAKKINSESNVVPLFYNLNKAKAEELNGDSLYKGLSLAYTGGNIGAPSNDITKIWNNGEITNEAIMVVKWLVAIVNWVIDYSKTLYKPNIPNNINETIKYYTNVKVPHFFKYAKKKNDNQIAEYNNTVVNRIERLFPSRNITYNFSQSNLGKFDYRMLMNEPNIQISGDIFSKYKQLTKHIKFNTSIDKQSDDKSLNNYLAIYDNCREQILQAGRECGLSELETIDRIIYGLFYEKSTQNKKAFWTMFDNEVFENLQKNLDTKFVQCERCRKRFYTVTPEYKICDKCDKYLNKKSLAVFRCKECGMLIEIPKTDKSTQKYCADCNSKIRRYGKYISKVKNR